MRTASTLSGIFITALLISPALAWMQSATDQREIAPGPRQLLPYVVLKGHTDGVHDAHFSQDGSRIVTTSKDESARLWDIEGNLLAVLGGHTGTVRGGLFSPDGSRILTWTREETARLWDSNGNPIAALTGEVYLGSFSPAGRLVATTSYSFADDMTARLWDFEGNEVAALEGHTDWVIVTTFSADGGRILTTSNDGTARLWTTDGKPLAIFSHVDDSSDERNAVWLAEFSPNGDRIITYSFDYTVRLWDAAGNQIAKVPGPPRWPSGGTPYNPDGTRFVTASFHDGTAHLYDSDLNEVVELLGHTGPVTGAGFSPDGSRILTTSSDRTARLWDGEGNPIAVLVGHTGTPIGTFSPDGNTILTNSDDRTERFARLWDSDGKLIAVLEGAGKFSPDGDRILTIHEGWVEVYPAPTAAPDASRENPE